MVKKEPPRRPFGWQYREQVEEKPGKAVVEQPGEAVVDKPVVVDSPAEPESALEVIREEVIREEVIPAEVVLKAQTNPVAPDADAPLTSAAIEAFAAQVVPLHTGAPVTPLPKPSRITKSEAK